MHYIADLHIHSCFSRATSRQMTIPDIAYWARKKGISLIASADFTHPEWLLRLKKHFSSSDRTGIFSFEGVDFVLGCEVSNIFSRNKRTYRVHSLIFCPAFEDVEGINKYLSSFGRLDADGRPMLGLDIEKMAEALLRISPHSFLAFAHIWTPWYSLFGDKSGFNSLEDAFPNGVPENVLALETGLSSDIVMNKMVSSLGGLRLFSNSDAHSPINIAREANVFSSQIDFFGLKECLKDKQDKRFLFTIEFFPQEGKYHYDGHRQCGVCLHPRDTELEKGLCPVCGRPLTIGVLNRVWRFSDRDEEVVKSQVKGDFRYAIPLVDIISVVRGRGKNTKTVLSEYISLLNKASELDLLLFLPMEDVRSVCPDSIAGAIESVRNGNVKVSPGYDGEYGRIQICPQSFTLF